MTERSQAPDKLCLDLEGTWATALNSEEQVGNGLGLGGPLARTSPPAPSAGSVSKPRPPPDTPLEAVPALSPPGHSSQNTLSTPLD